MPAKSSLSLVLATVLAAWVAVVPAHAKTVAFSGYTWDVRSGTGGPRPNQWNASNAWVDAAGALHLKVGRRSGVWTCAEVTLDQRLGFGTYEFKITGPIDQLDRNVFRSLRGFTSGNTPAFGQWSYRPTNPSSHIPQNPLPVHLNLWLFQGHAPTNGQTVEIVINNFRFTPQ